jgi:hypothetical protein
MIITPLHTGTSPPFYLTWRKHSAGTHACKYNSIVRSPLQFQDATSAAMSSCMLVACSSGETCLVGGEPDHLGRVSQGWLSCGAAAERVGTGGGSGGGPAVGAAAAAATVAAATVAAAAAAEESVLVLLVVLLLLLLLPSQSASDSVSQLAMHQSVVKQLCGGLVSVAQ